MPPAQADDIKTPHKEDLMPKSTLTITLGDDGLYHARIWATDSDGKRTSKRISGNSRKEVRQKAELFQNEIKRQKPTAMKMTVHEAAIGYIEYMERKKNPASASTLYSYHSMANSKLQSLRDIPIIDLTEEMLQDEIYELEMIYSGKYIHNIINFYVPAIRHFRKGFRPDLELPEKEAPVTRVPDADVLKARLHTLKDNKRLYIPVVLAAYCGLRRSEICALDLHTDVDYDVPYGSPDDLHNICVISISKARVPSKNSRYVTQGKTKSESGTRRLYAAQWIGDLLKEARDDPEFEWYSPDNTSHAFSKWAAKNNIGCSFHGLRHFFASIGKSLDIPDLYMMNLMGHSTVSMTNHYQEIMSDKELEVSDKLLRFLEQNKQG